MLNVGDRVPRFSAEASTGKTIDSADLLGAYWVIYFYPKAFTPGCTVETKRFRDNYPELRELGCEVIGVSTDDHATQCRFSDANTVTFPLIGDHEGHLTALFGVKWALFPVAKRVTFVVDPNGVVAARFHHELQVLKHMDKVLLFIKEARGRA